MSKVAQKAVESDQAQQQANQLKIQAEQGLKQLANDPTQKTVADQLNLQADQAQQHANQVKQELAELSQQPPVVIQQQAIELEQQAIVAAGSQAAQLSQQLTHQTPILTADTSPELGVTLSGVDVTHDDTF